jgi:uncharacterized protein with von Willebrand factor type A (vWA) domain
MGANKDEDKGGTSGGYAPPILLIFIGIFFQEHARKHTFSFIDRIREHTKHNPQQDQQVHVQRDQKKGKQTTHKKPLVSMLLPCQQ